MTVASLASWPLPGAAAARSQAPLFAMWARWVIPAGSGEAPLEPGVEQCSVLQVVNSGQVFSATSHLPVFLCKPIGRQMQLDRPTWTLPQPPVGPRYHGARFLVGGQSLPGSVTLQRCLARLPAASHMLSALELLLSLEPSTVGGGGSDGNSRGLPISRDTSLPPCDGLQPQASCVLWENIPLVAGANGL